MLPSKSVHNCSLQLGQELVYSFSLIFISSPETQSTTSVSELPPPPSLPFFLPTSSPFPFFLATQLGESHLITLSTEPAGHLIRLYHQCCRQCVSHSCQDCCSTRPSDFTTSMSAPFLSILNMTFRLSRHTVAPTELTELRGQRQCCRAECTP